MNVEDIELSDAQQKMLIAHRGGCTCHTLRMPPCHACTSSLTQDEAETLGFIPFRGVCLDAFGMDLTVGKEYEVRPADSIFVVVVNDAGQTRQYFKERFGGKG